MNHRGEIECPECMGEAYFQWGWIDGDEQGEGYYLHEEECWRCKGAGAVSEVDLLEGEPVRF